jgi:dihydroxy-acid dehydratase
LKKSGGLVILQGSLAPEGAVMKVSGTERLQHRGPARVFDSEEAAFEAVQHQNIKPGDVVVIRYEGPSGGPGMREMLAVTGAIVGAGLGETVASYRRDASRRHARFCVGHIAPEAARGGPDGGGARRRHDSHRRRRAARSISRSRTRRSSSVSPSGVRRSLATRRAVLGKYARLVSSASLGAVTG